MMCQPVSKRIDLFQLCKNIIVIIILQEVIVPLQKIDGGQKYIARNRSPFALLI